MSLDLTSLYKAYPERSKQIDTLKSLFASPTSHPPLPIFIHGPQATGKTCVLQLFHEIYQHFFPGHSAYVSCVSAFTLRLLFKKILHQWNPKSALPEKLDAMLAFVQLIQEHIPERSTKTRILILDEAEQLLTHPPHFFQALLKLGELTHRPIQLVFISTAVWSYFTRLHPCLTVDFPPYTKPELWPIFLRWHTHDLRESYHQDVGTKKRVLQFVLNAYIDALQTHAPDLTELYALVHKTYLSLLQKVLCGQVRLDEPVHLFRVIQADLAQAPARLYQGALEPCDGDLPVVSKYLLLASYIASHNPPKTDRLYFVKTSARDTTPASLRAVKHEGAQWFPLERMLRIFKMIAKEQENIDLLPVVASLATLKYLLTQKPTDPLHATIRLKSNFSLHLATRLSKSLDYDLQQCLYDPSAY